jgi:hypothetical protein
MRATTTFRFAIRIIQLCSSRNHKACDLHCAQFGVVPEAVSDRPFHAEMVRYFREIETTNQSLNNLRLRQHAFPIEQLARSFDLWSEAKACIRIQKAEFDGRLF